MENVTDETSNPFGMRPPCPHRCADGDRRAVFGYGDANADFHVVGDHPGAHGGGASGVPFTGAPGGERVLDVLAEVGFVTREPDGLAVDNCFLSYRYLCCPAGRTPTRDDYATFDRFLDAELRAVAADVLVPVGLRPTEYVLEEYTAKADRLEGGLENLHGEQVRGRGFLVVPVLDPTDWGRTEYREAVTALEAVLEIDYHQLVDLGRFLPDEDPYFVR